MKRILALWLVLTSALFAYSQIAPAQLLTTGAGRGYVVSSGGGGGGWGGPSANLIHRWALDSTNGATDLAGSLNGTLGSALTNTTGPSGAANTAKAQSSSANSFVSLPSFPMPSINPYAVGSAVSVFGWFNITDITAATFDGGTPRLLHFYTGGEYLQFFVDLGTGKLGIEWLYAGNDFGGVTTAAAFTNTTWVNAGFTKSDGDGASGYGTLTIYINCSPVSKGAPAGLSSSGTASALGARDGTGARSFAGSEAQYAIWNTELTAGQVATICPAY